jgi:hypothetical protein
MFEDSGGNVTLPIHNQAYNSIRRKPDFQGNKHVANMQWNSKN